MQGSEAEPLDVLIVGAGFSGIGLAIRLQKAGITRFKILERANSLGGTWRDNHYPNAGCDVPSYLYSFSFAPKRDWSEKYARQPEILKYLEDCVKDHRLEAQIECQCEVTSAQFSAADACWKVVSKDGRQFNARVMIMAVGQLSVPHIPEIPGLDQFQGEIWHSANWNDAFDLSDKRIAVVGNGASTIQFLPSVAQSARSVTLFQRTPNYISPLKNYRYSRMAHRAFRFLPGLQSLHRLTIFLQSEWRWLILRKGSFLAREATRWIRRGMLKDVGGLEHHQVIPTYPAGCKRILLSNDFLSTLNQPHVQLVSDSITSADGGSIKTTSRSYNVDAIIFGTGFRSHDFLNAVKIENGSGLRLDEAWNERPRTWFGLVTEGFPNLFFLYGPNTNLGHNSIIYMIESQIRTIVKALGKMRAERSQLIQVDPSAIKRFDERLHAQLEQTVWSGGCSSWYKTASGHIPNNWWGPAWEYRRQLRRRGLRDFRFGCINDSN